MNEKEFIKWLDENAPVDYEEVQHFSDEAGASIWIRFDLDKEGRLMPILVQYKIIDGFNEYNDYLIHQDDIDVTDEEN